MPVNLDEQDTREKWIVFKHPVHFRIDANVSHSYNIQTNVRLYVNGTDVRAGKRERDVNENTRDIKYRETEDGKQEILFFTRRHSVLEPQTKGNDYDPERIYYYIHIQIHCENTFKHSKILKCVHIPVTSYKVRFTCSVH